jgi:hypothetical protein
MEDFEAEVEAWPEPCSNQQEGFHQMLFYIISHLQSKVLHTHVELDEVVEPLSDIAILEYPTAEKIPSVTDRQASILRLISCFYQTVCVISMEQSLLPEEVYGSKDLLLEASHRVHAMI